MNKIEIENGKYQIENNNGIVKVYRYGSLWLDGVTKFELCLIQRIEELEQQNKRYREALEFYADRENYEPEHYDPDTHDYISMIDHDKGATARKALEGEQ